MKKKYLLSIAFDFLFIVILSKVRIVIITSLIGIGLGVLISPTGIETRNCFFYHTELANDGATAAEVEDLRLCSLQL
ncbi:MAG: hypothetical protein H6Q53_596 [Deltaproteobacteria bacterium]|nr:hypothetical protein [Deltaproteobacteria bacterium]